MVAKFKDKDHQKGLAKLKEDNHQEEDDQGGGRRVA
jgi:hypothetical protein